MSNICKLEKYEIDRTNNTGGIINMRIDELCQDKYIYLDWNVVKNMINPRNDKKN